MPHPTTAAAIKKALMLGVLLLGFPSQAQAPSPAQTLLDTTLDLLEEQYHGYAVWDATQLRQDFGTQLANVCQNQNPCPYSAADSIVTKMVASIGDSHTYRLDVAQTKARELEFAGAAASTPSFGWRVAIVPDAPMIAVTRVRQDSPAARAGLQRGDRILGFNNQRLNGFENPAQALAALRTAEASGERVRVRVARGTNTRTLEISSEPLAPWPPQLEIVDVAGVGKVATITFFQFKISGGVANVVHDLVAQANTANAAAMVLDVRDSAGGYVSECLASVTAFVDSVVLLDEFKWGTLRFESTQGNFVQTEANGQRYAHAVVRTPQRWRGPLVVLTNQNAKSAPEYLAYLLQTQNRATIIGERTLGALETSNSFFDLPDQSSLAISLGRSQHEDKSRFPAFVTPNLRVPDALAALVLGRDAPMQAALKHFGHTP